MIVLTLFGIVYLLAGFVYAVYILINGKDPIYAFPINVLGGPAIVIYMYYLTKKGERPPLTYF